MIAFAGVAFFLLVTAVVIVLWPLLKRSTSPVVRRHLSNLDIHRDQFSELENDLEAGTLGADRYEQAKKMNWRGASSKKLPRRPISRNRQPPARRFRSSSAWSFR